MKLSSLLFVFFQIFSQYLSSVSSEIISSTLNSQDHSNENDNSNNNNNIRRVLHKNSQEIQLQYQITISPRDTFLLNLDSLLSEEGFQRDNYCFSDLNFIDIPTVAFDTGNKTTKKTQPTDASEDSESTNDTSYSDEFIQSAQISKAFEVVSNDFPAIPKYLTHIAIQGTQIHMFIAEDSIQFFEPTSKPAPDNYETISLSLFTFSKCQANSYFRLPSDDQMYSQKSSTHTDPEVEIVGTFILVDCNLADPITTYGYLIIDVTNVDTIADISKDIISYVSTQTEESPACEKRSILVVFEINSSEELDVIFFEVVTGQTDATTGKVSLNIHQRTPFSIDLSLKRILAIGVDSMFGNYIYAFSNGSDGGALTIFLLSKDQKNPGKYILERFSKSKKVYDTTFYTVRFLSTFNQNLLELRNYMMFTSSTDNNQNLYVLDVTDSRHLTYVRWKILIPNLIIEHTYATRDFIIIHGCKDNEAPTPPDDGSTQTNPQQDYTTPRYPKCSDFPAEERIEYIAVFSSKQNRYNVHYYQEFPAGKQYSISMYTNNYQINQILLVDLVTGQIDTCTIEDHLLMITATGFSTQTNKFLTFMQGAQQSLQQMRVYFVQNRENIEISKQNPYYEGETMVQYDMFFSVDLEDIRGPQIEYQMIKNDEDVSKFNVTINNYLTSDFKLNLHGASTLPLPGSEIPINIIFAHISNAALHQIQVFTSFSTPTGYHIFNNECTASQNDNLNTCNRFEFLQNYPYFIQTFYSFSSQIYVALTQQGDEDSSLSFVIFYLESSESKKASIKQTNLTGVTSLEVISSDSKPFIGLFLASKSQIIILSCDIIEDEQQNSFPFMSTIQEIYFDQSFKKIIRVSMKLLTTKSIILVQTEDNKLFVVGIYIQSGYSNLKTILCSNTISSLDLGSNRECNFHVFRQSLVMVTCVSNNDNSQMILEYVINQFKELVLSRKYKLFSYRINIESLYKSTSDKVFFYQLGYRMNSEERNQENVLLVFDPDAKSTNCLRAAVSISTQKFIIPFQAESSVGNYILYDSTASYQVLINQAHTIKNLTKNQNQFISPFIFLTYVLPPPKQFESAFQMFSMNKSPFASFEVTQFDVADVKFNLTLLALSNSRQSFVVRELRFSTNLNQYMIHGRKVDIGWSVLTSTNRLITLPLPQDTFSGPLKKMLLTNTTDSCIFTDDRFAGMIPDTSSAKNPTSPLISQQPDLNSPESYFVSLSQLLLPTQPFKNYAEVQSDYGVLIDSAFFEYGNFFVFLYNRTLILMPSMNNDNNFSSKQEIEISLFFHSTSLNFTECQMNHHKTWTFFLVLCQFSKSMLLYRVHYEFDAAANPPIEPRIISSRIVNFVSEDVGYIRYIAMSENQGQAYDIEALKVFMVASIDMNYVESFVKICQFKVKQTQEIFSVTLIIDARAFDLRTLPVIDFSIISFTPKLSNDLSVTPTPPFDQQNVIPTEILSQSISESATSTQEKQLLALVTQKQIAFLILNGENPPQIEMKYLLSTTVAGQESNLVTFFTINLIRISLYTKPQDTKSQSSSTSTQATQYIEISYVIQYNQFDDAVSAQLILSSSKSSGEWKLYKGPITLNLFSHYKACASYSAKPIVFLPPANSRTIADPTIKYLARICVFATSENSQSPLNDDSTPDIFNLIFFAHTSSNQTSFSIQQVIQLPYFNNLPSPAYFFSTTNSTKLLLTSYFNMYKDYTVQESYVVNFYFNNQMQYMISQKILVVTGVNERFSDIARFHYNVIDYSLLDSQKSNYLMLILKSSATFLSLVFFLIPTVKAILYVRKTSNSRKKASRAKSQRSQTPKKLIVTTTAYSSIISDNQHSNNHNNNHLNYMIPPLRNNSSEKDSPSFTSDNSSSMISQYQCSYLRQRNEESSIDSPSDRKFTDSFFI